MWTANSNGVWVCLSIYDEFNFYNFGNSDEFVNDAEMQKITIFY